MQHAMPRQVPIRVNGKSCLLPRRSTFPRRPGSYKGVTFVSISIPTRIAWQHDGPGYLVESCLGLTTRSHELAPSAENEPWSIFWNRSLPIEEVQWDPEEAVVMVDSQPCTGPA